MIGSMGRYVVGS